MVALRWHLDYSLAIGDGTGEGGILPRDALNAEAPAVRRALRRLLESAESGQIGFWSLPDGDHTLTRCREVAERIPRDVSDVLLLGIGGSSLGARALYEALADPAGPRRGERRLWFADNSDPWRPLAWLSRALDPERTVVLAVSKSGKTLETAALLQVVRRWQRAHLPEEEARRRLLLVTDPHGGPLRRIAREEGVTALDVPPAVGGRFSVLGAVGLLPAVLAGHDAEGLLRGAAEMREDCTRTKLEENPAALLAALHVLHARLFGRRIHVLMPYADALRAFSAWWVQLWAESLGKWRDREGRWRREGFTPLAAVGATDQHSLLQLLVEGPPDKLLTFVRVLKPAEDADVPGTPPLPHLGGKTLGELLQVQWRATALALAEAGTPSLTIALDRLDAPHVGALFFLHEAATAIAGGLLGIDPFDQPGVERGKRLAAALLGHPDTSEADRAAARRLGTRLGRHRLGSG